MRKNKLNNLQSMQLIGPSRPQDILKYDPESICIDPVFNIPDRYKKEGKAYGRIRFTNTYYKCGSNHIFVNEKFDSYDGLTIFTELILPNSHVHIFIGDNTCNDIGLISFCERISKIKDIKIVVHAPSNLTFIKNLITYFPKIIPDHSVKIVVCKFPYNVDFQCTNWFEWELNRDTTIKSQIGSIRLSSRGQKLTGIRVVLNRFHMIPSTERHAFDVIGIDSNFVSGVYSRKTDMFELI